MRETGTPVRICAPAAVADFASAAVSAPTPPRKTGGPEVACPSAAACINNPVLVDRKSTRLNSSHLGISYAVFCLKKKNTAGNSDGVGPHFRHGGAGGRDDRQRGKHAEEARSEQQ